MKLWTEGADGKLNVATTYVGHTSYVTAVAYIAPGATPQWPKGALVSGAPARARASADLSFVVGHKVVQLGVLSMIMFRAAAHSVPTTSEHRLSGRPIYCLFTSHFGACDTLEPSLSLQLPYTTHRPSSCFPGTLQAVQCISMDLSAAYHAHVFRDETSCMARVPGHARAGLGRGDRGGGTDAGGPQVPGLVPDADDAQLHGKGVASTFQHA